MSATAAGIDAACGIAAGCGIATVAVPSGVVLLNDCRPIGVGEVIEGIAGAGTAGLALSCAGGCAAGVCSIELSIAGIGGAVSLSSSVIAILKVPSTITTTLAPTSSERILEVMVEGSLFGSLLASLLEALALPAVDLNGPRPGLSAGGAAAAACAARRAAAMKLEVLTGSRLSAGISLIALSEAAMRSDGVAARPVGRVPGSSG